jgi:hypothetical protein
MGLSDHTVGAVLAVSDLDAARRFDLDATMAELAGRGVVFEQYDQPGIKTDPRGVFDAGPFRAAWVKDPDGNTLAMTERRG